MAFLVFLFLVFAIGFHYVDLAGLEFTVSQVGFELRETCLPLALKGCTPGPGPGLNFQLKFCSTLLD